MIITYQDIPFIRSGISASDNIIFASGSYDLVHAGHAFFLEQAKKLAPRSKLFVSVGRDAEIKKNKGPDRPIMNEVVRIAMIDALKPVDYSFLTNCTMGSQHWLAPIREILGLLRPNVYVVNDDAGDLLERDKISKEFNVKMHILGMDFPSKTDKISTSKIIEKIRALKTEGSIYQ